MFHKNVQGLDWETNRLFYEYSWPGNVRQLKNCLESAMNFVDHDTPHREKSIYLNICWAMHFKALQKKKPTLPANTEEPSPPQTSSDTIPKKSRWVLLNKSVSKEKTELLRLYFLITAILPKLQNIWICQDNLLFIALKNTKLNKSKFFKAYCLLIKQ